MSTLSVGIIAFGAFLHHYSNKQYDMLNEQIKRTIKIFEYPEELSSITEKNSIIKIPSHYINYSLPIGIIKMNGIIYEPYYTSNYKYEPLLDKYIETKSIKYIKKSQTIGTQILFPNCFHELEPNPNMLDYKNSILFGNNSYTTFDIPSNAIKKYEEIVGKNIPNFKSDLKCYNGISYNWLYTNKLELEQNLLEKSSELYLIVNKSSNNKYIIDAMSNDKNEIIKKKFSDEIDYANAINCLSIVSMVGGICLFFITN